MEFLNEIEISEKDKKVSKDSIERTIKKVVEKLKSPDFAIKEVKEIKEGEEPEGEIESEEEKKAKYEKQASDLSVFFERNVHGLFDYKFSGSLEEDLANIYNQIDLINKNMEYEIRARFYRAQIHEMKDDIKYAEACGRAEYERVMTNYMRIKNTVIKDILDAFDNYEKEDKKYNEYLKAYKKNDEMSFDEYKEKYDGTRIEYSEFLPQIVELAKKTNDIIRFYPANSFVKDKLNINKDIERHEKVVVKSAEIAGTEEFINNLETAFKGKEIGTGKDKKVISSISAFQCRERIFAWYTEREKMQILRYETELYYLTNKNNFEKDCVENDESIDNKDAKLEQLENEYFAEQERISAGIEDAIQSIALLKTAIANDKRINTEKGFDGKLKSLEASNKQRSIKKEYDIVRQFRADVIFDIEKAKQDAEDLREQRRLESEMAERGEDGSEANADNKASGLKGFFAGLFGGNKAKKSKDKKEEEDED